MRQVELFTLPTRDATVGHWRFRGDLNDSSASGNDLLGDGIVADDWIVGYSEPGQTALRLDGTKQASLAAAVAGDFDFGSDDISFEFILRVGNSSATQYLIDKRDTVNGFAIYVLGGRVFAAIIANASFANHMSTFLVGDNRWHYVAVCIDRANEEMHFYVDGVADPDNPHSTSTVAGGISAPTADLTIGEDLVGDIDEMCVSRECLTPAAVTDRARARYDESVALDDRLLVDHLPAINQANEDLALLLSPMNQLYQELAGRGNDARELISWHSCPEQFLPGIASTLGFELLDAPFATEAERRELLRWATWIYRRKGTVTAAKKIIGLLGFDSQFTVVYGEAIAFVANAGRAWLFDLVRTALIDEQFTELTSLWDQPLSGGSTWVVIGGSMRGSGNGSDSSRNARLFTNTLKQYRLSVPFSVVSLGAAANPEFGIYLRYQNDTNWVRIRIDGIQTISYRRIIFDTRIANVLTETVLAELTGIVDPYTGSHLLRVFADHDTNRYTVAIDDVTVCHFRQINCGSVTSAKKGLWVNRDAVVDFDAFQIDTVDPVEVTRIFDPDWKPTKVQIGIADNSHPDHEEAKEEYFKEVIPKYIPIGVAVEWVFWEGGPPQ